MKPRLFVLAFCLLTLPAATIAQGQANQAQPNQAQPNQDQSVQSQPNQDQRAQPTARSTERIIKEVRHELLMLPYFTVFDNIGYKVEGFTVTLLGQVTRPVTKSDAENAVKHIEGVDHVDDQIEVLPPSPMDDRLRRRLFRASMATRPCKDMTWACRSPSASSSRTATSRSKASSTARATRI